MSKRISLTQGKVAIVDDADYEWLNQWKWRVLKGYDTWYAVRNIYKDGKRTTAKMHREILKPPIGVEIDHRDRDGLNNQRYNMRVATHAENAHNRRKQEETSQFKGVTWYRWKTKWLGQIQVKNQRIHLGYFLSQTEAALAYDRAARTYFGEFANTNF